MATTPTKRRSQPAADKRRAAPQPAVLAPLPAPIESLFARYPALFGFSVRGVADVPDSCSRSGDEGELFVSDVGVSPMLSNDQFEEMFDDIADTLSELLAEQPGALAMLCGRTFARTLH